MLFLIPFELIEYCERKASSHGLNKDPFEKPGHVTIWNDDKEKYIVYRMVGRLISEPSIIIETNSCPEYLIYSVWRLIKIMKKFNLEKAIKKEKNTK